MPQQDPDTVEDEVTPKEDEIIDINLGEETYKVPKKFAELLAKHQTEVTQTFTSLNNKVKTLEEQLGAATEQPEPNEDEDNNLENMLFSNPKKAIAKIREEIQKEITTNIKSETSQNEAQKQFWDLFWNTNKELSSKEDNTIVQALFNSHYSEFADSGMTVEQTIKKLGEMTKKELLRISQKFNKAPAEEDNVHTLEPVMSVSAKKGKALLAEDDFGSISDILKQRRRKRGF